MKGPSRRWWLDVLGTRQVILTRSLRSILSLSLDQFWGRGTSPILPVMQMVISKFHAIIVYLYDRQKLMGHICLPAGVRRKVGIQWVLGKM